MHIPSSMFCNRCLFIIKKSLVKLRKQWDEEVLVFFWWCLVYVGLYGGREESPIKGTHTLGSELGYCGEVIELEPETHQSQGSARAWLLSPLFFLSSHLLLSLDSFPLSTILLHIHQDFRLHVAFWWSLCDLQMYTLFSAVFYAVGADPSQDSHSGWLPTGSG